MDVKRYLYQTIVNLVIVSPLMMIVLAAGPSLAIISYSSFVTVSVMLGIIGAVYTLAALNLLLTAAGRSLEMREDL